jgi:hypothetical protein
MRRPAAGPALLAAGLALGAVTLAWDWASDSWARWDGPSAGPGITALALTWERTHCYECEAPAERDASATRARARPRR